MRDLITCPKEKKQSYKKMMRRYKKLFKKYAKEICPYDYRFGTEPFIDFLRWMQEYYELGYNVWAMERKDEDQATYKDALTRAESLKQTIYYYDRMDNCHDDYFKVVFEEEEMKRLVKMGWTLQPRTNTDFLTNSYFLTLYPTHKQCSDECNKAYGEWKHKFFESLERYISEWWD